MFNSFHLEGVEAFNKHEYETAKSLFLQAIGKNPEEPESYLFLGKSFFFCNEKSKAIAPLKKYIELNQYNLDKIVPVSYAFDVLGQCYEAENKDTAAMTCYTSATKINPLAASAWHNLGLFHIKSAQHYLEMDLANSIKLFSRAEDFLKKALAICSTNPMFLNSLASWYEKYIEALKKVTAKEESVHNHFMLAIQYYQQALTLCLEDDIALQNIIRSNLTECLAQYGHHLYRAENYVRALEFYTQAIGFDPDHLVVINQIGMSLFKKNLFPEARKSFAAILEKTSDPQERADAWLNIACTYRAEQLWADAENALYEARKFASEDPSILEEEQKLKDLKAQASLIAASQTMFSHPDPDSLSELSAEMQEKTSSAFPKT